MGVWTSTTLRYASSTRWVREENLFSSFNNSCKPDSSREDSSGIRPAARLWESDPFSMAVKRSSSSSGLNLLMTSSTRLEISTP
ncbi:hypothetical protein B9Q09_02705 [Candidatus Marsarchaeota G2 archaeon ECH_B_SAG-C16]|nr:MAG: hypothetical protein B9Q09_02705 [Candidatus Marsarchaeota G2 archaeon ECH_B_SAG-C16]